MRVRRKSTLVLGPVLREKNKHKGTSKIERPEIQRRQERVEELSRAVDALELPRRPNRVTEPVASEADLAESAEPGTMVFSVADQTMWVMQADGHSWVRLEQIADEGEQSRTESLAGDASLFRGILFGPQRGNRRH